MITLLLSASLIACDLKEEFELLDSYTELQAPRMRPFINGIDRDDECLPYRENQVILSNGQPLSASYIDLGGQNYIASAAPTKESAPFFWHMIAENEADQIVMLCELEEFGKEACFPYWNSNKVTLLSDEWPSDSLQIRKFLLRHEGKEKIVTHYWARHWPDRSIISQEKVRELVERIIRDKHSHAPIIIHCHAGVGRTGTVITAHIISKYGPQNLFEIVSKLRFQRPYMVGDFSQYKFCHDYNELSKALLSIPENKE